MGIARETEGTTSKEDLRGPVTGNRVEQVTENRRTDGAVNRKRLVTKPTRRRPDGEG
mgnify:CR=1 FL=1